MENYIKFNDPAQLEIDSIPDILKKYHWFPWGRKPNSNGRFTKYPIDRRTHDLAKVNDMTTAGTFDEALAYYEQHKGQVIKRLQCQIAGIGVAVEDDLVAIDLDQCVADGKIENFAKEIINKFDCYTELSPSGTGIRIIAKGKRPINKQKSNMEKVEIFHSESAKFVTMTGNVILNSPIRENQEAIDWLCEKYFEKDERVVVPKSENIKKITDPAKKQKQARAYLKKVPPAIEGEGGDNHTFTTACRLVIDFDLSPDEAMPIFEEWNENCVPPWNEKELWQKLKSADKRPDERGGKLRAKKLDEDDYKAVESIIGNDKKKDEPEGIKSTKVIEPQKAEPPKEIEKRFFTVKELRERRKADPPKWLVKDHLVEGGFGYFLGESGVGKTFVAQSYALSIAHGLPFLNKFNTSQGGVFYIGHEGNDDFDVRCEAWHNYHGLEPNDLFRYLPEDFDLTDVKDVKELNKLVEEFIKSLPSGFDLKLLVFDTLFNQLGGGNENAPEIMGKVIRYQRMLIAKYKTAVLNLSHPGYTNKKRPRGHSSQKGALNSIFLLEGKPATGISMECTKLKSRIEIPEYKILFDTVDSGILDEDGNKLTAPVPKNTLMSWREKLTHLGESSEKIFFTAFRNFKLETFRYTDLMNLLVTDSMSLATFKRLMSNLVKHDFLIKQGKRYIVNANADPTNQIKFEGGSLVKKGLI